MAGRGRVGLGIARRGDAKLGKANIFIGEKNE